MKILQINKYYYLKSGSERYMFNLSSLLESHGHKIIPFAMKHEKNIHTKYSKYFIENIDYNNVVNYGTSKKIFAALKTIYSREATNKLQKLITTEHPDIAHVHKFSNTLTPSIFYALKKHKIPIVHTLHDYRIVCPNYNMYNPNLYQICEACKGHKYFNALRTKCQKSSYMVSLNITVESYLYYLLRTYNQMIDAFIAPSKFIMKKVAEFGIDKEKIHHIPHFIKYNLYTPSYENSGYIIYFGRLVKHKGVKTLIKAMKTLTDLKLYIIGEGPQRNELEIYATKNRMNNVTFLGYVPDSKLINLIRNCMFTVVPSEWYEPFGFTILESFALGKPVIGANIGAIPDIITNGHNGYIFHPGDAEDLAEKIKSLSQEQNRIKTMGKKARQTVEQEYNADLHYEKLIKIYNKLLN